MPSTTRRASTSFRMVVQAPFASSAWRGSLVAVVYTACTSPSMRRDRVDPAGQPEKVASRPERDVTLGAADLLLDGHEPQGELRDGPHGLRLCRARDGVLVVGLVVLRDRVAGIDLRQHRHSRREQPARNLDVPRRGERRLVAGGGSRAGGCGDVQRLLERAVTEHTHPHGGRRRVRLVGYDEDPQEAVAILDQGDGTRRRLDALRELQSIDAQVERGPRGRPVGDRHPCRRVRRDRHRAGGRARRIGGAAARHIGRGHGVGPRRQVRQRGAGLDRGREAVGARDAHGGVGAAGEPVHRELQDAGRRGTGDGERRRYGLPRGDRDVARVLTLRLAVGRQAAELDAVLPRFEPIEGHARGRTDRPRRPAVHARGVAVRDRAASRKWSSSPAGSRSRPRR